MSQPRVTSCPHCDAPIGDDPIGARGDGARRDGPLGAEETRCAIPVAACPRCGGLPTVCGGFALGPEVGRGGVARVHAAVHADGRTGVVKVLDRSARNPWQVHQLFARSARLAASFAHPGLPRVLGFECAGSRSFFAMERLHGGTLSERVAAGRLVHGDAFEALLRGLLEGVAYLHARGVVHGDVTPRNVMFRAEDDERPVLIDLDGLCSPEERGLPSLVMTPGYTAPEQRAGTVTAGSDLYGVGATMVFAATGRSPDRHDRTGDARDLAVSLPGIGSEARRLVQQLLDLEPRRRPRSALQALRALDRRTRGGWSPQALAAALVLTLVLTIAVLARAAAVP